MFSAVVAQLEHCHHLIDLAVKILVISFVDQGVRSGTTRRENQDYTCPQCDRTFSYHIGLVGRLRIHRTETGEPVPGAPTYAHRTRLHCPHCPCTFTYRTGLFGHRRIHEGGIDRSLDTPTLPSPTPYSSPCAPTNLSATDIGDTDFTTPHSSPSSSPSSSSSSSSSSFTATTTAAPASVVHDITTDIPDTTTGITPPSFDFRGDEQDYIYPHDDRTFTSLIGLVGHLRIHRTETGERMPGAPTYTHRTRLHCPHCPRTFTHIRSHAHLRRPVVDNRRLHHTSTHSKPPQPSPPYINTHPPHAPNCHLPRKREVYISTWSPCGFGCRGDLSPRLSGHVKRRG
nr:unnamed protein product [Spirometra erinaceieuropaei]